MTQTCLVNLFHLDPPRNGGAGRVARELCQILAQCDQNGQLQVVFAVGWRMAGVFAAWLDYPQAVVLPVLPETGLSPLVASFQPDALVSPLPTMHPFDEPYLLANVPHIVAMPDTLLMDKPHLVQPDNVALTKKTYARLHQAAAIVTPTGFSCRQLIHHLDLPPEKVVVIPHTGNFTCTVLSQPPVNGLQPFVFYPANGWPHKRHSLLLQLMNRVWLARPELKLVLTGWHEADYIAGLVQEYGCPPEQIIDLGYVPDHQLAWLYAHAEALLFISEYEGFGRPILEAMSHNCPVICAPHAAIPEVAGDAALYVDSDDVPGWCNALLTQLPSQRAALITRGQEHVKQFTPPQVQKKWHQLLSRVGLELSPAPAGQPRPANIPAVVNQELLEWADKYAQIQHEAEAKEAEIQKLLGRLKAKEETIKTLQADVSAKNAQLAGQGEMLQELHKALDVQKELASLRLEITAKENRLQSQQIELKEVVRQLDEIQTTQRELKRLHLEPGDKEVLLQNRPAEVKALLQQLADTADIRAEAERLRTKLAEREGAIQQAQHELQAKQAVIEEQLAFYKAWRHYWWLLKPVYHIQKWAKNNFGPRLGHLRHYAPIPVVAPTWYKNTAAPLDPPRISIVTPTFNQAHFLERTLSSVLEQQYPNLEYIVQDGGSSDDTQAILARYGNRLAHYEVRRDNGQAHALNLGFAHATGDIMAWLNSDDILLPGALNTIAAYFANHPNVDVVYGHRILIDENDQEIGRWVLPGHDDYILNWADYVPQETLFWRRRIWDKAGGYIDESYKFALDWELLLRFQAAEAKMVRLPRFLGAFRVHQTQKSSVQIYSVGHEEMTRLRERRHGRTVSYEEIDWAIRPYLIRSVVYHKLYRLGVLRY